MRLTLPRQEGRHLATSPRLAILFILGLTVVTGLAIFNPGSLFQPAKPPHTQLSRAQRAPASQAKLVESYGKLPLAFEANQGQTDSAVKFLSRGSGYTLFLTGSEAVLALRAGNQKAKGKGQREEIKNEDTRPFSLLPPHLQSLLRDSEPATDHAPRVTDDLFAPLIQNPKSQIQNLPAPSTESPEPSTLRMKLVGANPTAKVTGLDALPGKSNYFIGNDPKKWRTNVANYAKVKYEGVYPGIDLVYYGNQGQLEYDWVVAPGADPKAIRFAVETGNSKLETRQSQIRNQKSQIAIDPNGDLVIPTDAGEVRFHKPLVYQLAEKQKAKGKGQNAKVEDQRTTDDGQRTTRLSNSPFTIHNSQFVDGRFVLLAQNRVGFEVPNYDKTKPLIIDPVLAYSTYLGGSNDDLAQGIAVDAAGNAYVAGTLYSTDYPTSNPLQPANGGVLNAFVTKLNAAGNALVYSTYLGGTYDDQGWAIAVDSTGNAYLTGIAYSTDFPTVNALQPANAGGSDAFVAELNAAGNALVYSTYLGGSSDDRGYAIAVDPFGNAYTTGYIFSSDFPTANPVQASPGGGSCGIPGAPEPCADAFVAKLNTSGSALVYSTYLGGSGFDNGNGIAVDTAGNAYVTGFTDSADFPTSSGALQTTCGTLLRCRGLGFVTKLDDTGSTFAYSTYMGYHHTAIAVDTSGNAYVPQGGGVAKLNSSGSALVYETFISGVLGADASGIAVDSAGNAYVTGTTYSFDFPTVAPIQACANCGTTGRGGADVFVTKWNAAGSALLFSTFLGGNGNEVAYGIAVDFAGNAYVAGSTPDTFPTTIGSFQTAFGGGREDAFVAKLAGLALPAVVFQPNVLTISQAIGTTSSPQSITLTNGGDAILNISSIAATGDFAETDTCVSSSPLAPGSSCSISVTFAPTTAGTTTGSLTITDDAPTSPQTVSLTGTGVAPTASVSPTSLTFVNQVVGTTSAPQTVTFTNTAAGLLTITSSSVSTDFSLTTTCGASLDAGGSCTFDVTFAPTSAGAKSGTLTINDNAGNSPQTVALSGTALQPAVSLSPDSLIFAEQIVGTTSASQDLTLTNSGSSTLHISGIAAGGDFAQTNTCGSTLAAGANCLITVTFKPTTTGAQTGAITVTDDAPGSPQGASLTGAGVQPLVSLSPESLTFPSQFVGTTGLPQNVTLTNNGDFPLTILDVGASADFAPTNGCTTSVAPGVGCTISVFFDPSAAGTRTGTLTVTDNAPGSPHTVALSGTGMDFGFSASSSSTTVSAGQTASYLVSVAPQGGFNQSVALTCTGAPTLSTCSVSPGAVTLNGTASTDVTVTVTTTAGSSTLPWAKKLPPGVTGSR